MILRPPRATRFSFFFFFNDTATTEIYTLSLHDALPISSRQNVVWPGAVVSQDLTGLRSNKHRSVVDRKSTRLNSSHLVISYAVFCLKKKKIQSPCTLVCPLLLANN